MWENHRMLISCFFLIAISCHDTKAVPLFLKPTAAKPANGESENVSVYTTARNSPLRMEPSNVYELIAKNVLERTFPPVVSHFILVTARDRQTFARLRALRMSRSTTTKAPTNKLELVEDPLEGSGEEDPNAKEPLDPDLIKINPSFKVNETKKLERITNNTKSNEISHEDDDDDDDDDEEDESVEEAEPPIMKARNDEGGLYNVLEFFSQVAILFQGAVDFLFSRRPPLPTPPPNH